MMLLRQRIPAAWTCALLCLGGPAFSQPGESATLFDAEIAPLLARQCFECHDSETRKGKLDLSRKEHAMRGGKSGAVIIPGNSAESPLWQSVHADEMPEDRPPLSAEEKTALRKWIDAGAVWTADAIDPQAYTRDRRSAVQWIWRLTVPEYIETVRAATGVDIAREARELLPAEGRADGFKNTAYNLKVDLAHVQAYARLAEMIVNRMDVLKFAERFGNSGDLSEPAMRDLIAGMGRWLLRGPLDPDELKGFLRICDAAAKETGDFRKTAGLLLEVMLQSPRFVYRLEKQRGDGGRRALEPHEHAARLSFMIWGAPPDEALLQAAEAGMLADDSKIRAQVERMLADPRAIRRSRQFIEEWLDLDRLANLQPNRKHFPGWSAELAVDMREETLAFFEHVVWKEKRPLGDLLNAKVTFATPRLAAHYGLDPKLRAEADPSSAPEPLPRPGAPGLQALYTFSSGGGERVPDVSESGDDLSLQIENPGAVKWTSAGLEIRGSTMIATKQPPKRLIEEARRSNAFTIEAWITPADRKQNGPARIVTISADPSRRNTTLGQDGDKFEVRFRSTKTDANGQPPLGSRGGAVKTERTHLVFTRETGGKTRLYLNGKQVSASEAGGDLGNWDGSFRLFLGNEGTKDRPWRGTLHRVALYTRALGKEEVARHFAAGGAGAVPQTIARYDLSSVPQRGGLLTQGSLLTIGGDDASMVTRGLFVLRDLLSSAIGSAPPGTDTRPVPPKPGQSRRAVAESRVSNKECASCHARFEPLAFGLEKFDGVGAFREKDEHGNGLREDGQIIFPGAAEPVAYRTIGDFMNSLAQSARARKNITRKLTQFAIGRPLLESDARAVDAIHEAAERGGGTYASVIQALAQSDLLRAARTEVLLTQNESNP